PIPFAPPETKAILPVKSNIKPPTVLFVILYQPYCINGKLTQNFCHQSQLCRVSAFSIYAE
ncbi:hypothetical protein SJ059_29380, partial [Klebsiella aerogenes]|nr:hypothetical protein [Klebsiella aerogenes]